MTSLAQQLKQLAKPHTQALLGLDNRKSSLLFDPKEAANVDRETFHALGLNGLQELQNMESSFAEFEPLLFSESALNFERSVQTKEVNATLDKTIAQILLKLSPYFLLRPVHKVLEWLLYRYHIQWYNVDQLMMCILPYHESNMFVRVIQLLQLDDPTNRWHWFQPIQKPGTPVARGTVINHCRADPGFFTFICEMVPQFLKAHKIPQTQTLRVVMSFYATTITGAVAQGNLKEELVTRLLPYIVHGCKSKNTEYNAASYMILSQLVSTTKLKMPFFNDLLPALTENIKKSLVNEGLMCICLVFETQSLIEYRGSILHNLCRLPSLIPTINLLSSKYKISKFLGFFMTWLTEAAIQESMTESEGDELNTALQRLLSDVQLPDVVAQDIVKLLLDKFVKIHLKKEKDNGALDGIKHIVGIVEKRYPLSVDTVIDREAKTQFMKRRQNILQEFVCASMSAVKHSIVPYSQTSITLGAYHPTSQIRIQAVKQLARMVKKNTMEDIEFASAVFVARLQDDLPSVIAVALEDYEVLFKVLKPLELLEKLTNILRRSVKFNCRYKVLVLSRCMNILTSEHFSDVSMDSLMILLIPYLVTQTEVSSLIYSALHIKLSLGNKETGEDVGSHPENSSSLFFAQLSMYLVNLDEIKRQKFLENLLSRDKAELQSLYDVVALFMLTKLITDSDCIKKDLYCGYIVRILQDVHTNVLNCSEKNLELSVKKVLGAIDVFFSEFVKYTNTYGDISYIKIPSIVLAWALKELITVQKIPANLKDCEWWDIENEGNPSLQLLKDLFEVLTAMTLKEPLKVYRYLLVRFIKVFSEPTVVLYRFLAMMWRESNILTQLQALYVGSICISQISTSEAEEIQKEKSVIASIMFCLSSKEEMVRSAAMSCVVGLHQKCQKDYLLEKLTSRTCEINADGNHISEAIFVILGKAFSTTNKNVLDSLKSIVSLILDPTTPLLIKECLLTQTSLIDHKDLFENLMPLLCAMLKKCVDSGLSEQETRCVHLLVQRFTINIGKAMSQNKDIMDIFVQCIKMDRGHNKNYMPIQYVTLSQIKKQLFNEASPDIQQQLLALMFDVWVDSNNPNTSSAISKAIKGLTLGAKHFIFELKKVEPSAKAGTVRMTSAKRRKSQLNPQSQTDSTLLDTKPWQRAILVLEMLQLKKKLMGGNTLITPLFSILKNVLEMETEVPTDYVKQLIISCLHNICRKLTVEDADSEERYFNVELIVQCIRTSDNPQTHHHALLLLTKAAQLFPSLVLHNIMSIFTFMGANIMRKDDSYSFQVITQMVKIVIPALIQASEMSDEETSQVESIVHSVIQVFVDAYPHMPEHRRLPIFTQLVKTLDPNKYLWVTLLMLLDGYTLRESGKSEDDKSPGLHHDIQFCLMICEEFSPSQQVFSGQKLLNLIRNLPTTGVQSVKKRLRRDVQCRIIAKKSELISVDVHTPKQLRHFRYIITTFIAQILSSESFLEKVDDDSTDSKEVIPIYQTIIEEDLQYISQVARLQIENTNPHEAKFWKVILHKAYDILDKVNNLLPNSVFVEVVSGLMKNDLQLIRRKAMELLNNKLQAKPIPEAEIPLFMSLIEQLVEVISLKGHLMQESVYNQQTAFFCLKLQCRIFGIVHPMRFKGLLPIVIEVFSREGVAPQVASGALLCLAELCLILKAHAIPYLDKFMPKVISILENDAELLSNNILLISAVSAIQKIFPSLAQFMSPYIYDIIAKFVKLSVLPEVESEVFLKSQLQTKLKGLHQNLATLLPPRVIIPAISSCYDKTKDKDRKSLGALFSLLADHLKQLPKEELQSHQTVIINFFLTSLDFRQLHKKMSVSEVEETEDQIIQAMLAMVMKMSESSFRPMFFKLFDWASRNESRLSRLLTFYRLTDSFAAKLKSLFTLFAGHIIKNAANLLNENNVTKSSTTTFGSGESAISQSCLLVTYILDTLHKCFIYDKEDLVNKERFDTLMQPLVDQIENIQGGETVYQDRIANHVVPCIAQFAVAAGDESSWKPLNYHVLLKTRNDSAKVRFAALKVVQEMTEKLGENYVSLLPETIPFLAELMEDESFEVEQLCQDVITKLEAVLGEPLQKYF